MRFLLLAIAWIVSALVETKAQESLTFDRSGIEVEIKGLSKEQHLEARDVISQQLALTTDQRMTPPLADDMAFFLKQKLLEQGFVSVNVDWEIQQGMLLLKVAEGASYQIGEVKFNHAEELDEQELRQYLLRVTSAKAGTTATHPAYVAADIDSGVSWVQRYLQAQGYLDAEVDLLEPHFREESREVDLHLNLKLGVRYRIQQVEITGGKTILLEQERLLFADLRGQPFNENRLEELRIKLNDLYRNEGFFSSEIMMRVEHHGRQKNNVVVTYHIEPQYRYKVAEVTIDSEMSRGAQRLVRSMYAPTLGEVYAPLNLELYHRRLLDTEVFQRLEVQPEVLPDNQLRLVFDGEEAKRITLSAYGGYETFYGMILGVEARHVNLFDLGNAARVKVEASGRGLNGGLLWLDPAFLNTPYSLESELSAENVSMFEYDRQSFQLRSSLRRYWNKHLTTTAFASYSLNEVTTAIMEDLPFLGNTDYRVMQVGLTTSLDYRNSPVLPTRGWMATWSVKQGLDTAGAEVEYTATDLLFSVYQPLSKKWRMAARAETRVIDGQSGIEELPIDLRLFGGGANSVRSFPEREMGYKTDSSTPIGGSMSQLFSLEFSYEWKSNLEFAIFGDAGSLSREEDQLFEQIGDLNYAIGVGIRYKLPVGPLRVDYGYNPDRQEGDPVGALHITFGFPF